MIELGRALPPLPEAARTEANKVRGCASQVWLATEVTLKLRRGAAPAVAPYRLGALSRTASKLEMVPRSEKIKVPCRRPRRQEWPATTFAGSRK